MPKPLGENKAKHRITPNQEIDWDKLDAILRFNASMKDCVEIIGCSCNTIERRIKSKFNLTFDEYRDLKMSKTRMRLAQKQFDVAMAGDRALLIWLGKQCLGQTEKQEQIITYGREQIENIPIEERIKQLEATLETKTK